MEYIRNILSKAILPRHTITLGFRISKFALQIMADNYPILQELAYCLEAHNVPTPQYTDLFSASPSFRDFSHWLIREPGAIQRWIQESAGGVAREVASCSVGAMRAGRQSNNQDARIRIAKPGHRLCPNIPDPYKPCA